MNFQSADPYGSYEWSTRITVRGFNQNRMGFTLDGVPLGDMTYGNHNGLHISRAIPTELVDSVTLSQGTGSLATASASNLGGAIQFVSADPSSSFGVDAAQSFGTEETRRTFVRVETGELGDAAHGCLIGRRRLDEKWKGAGDQDVQMYNLKLVQPIGEGDLKFSYNYSDRAEIDYQDLSKDIVARRGHEWDNYYSRLVRGGRRRRHLQASGQNDAIIATTRIGTRPAFARTISATWRSISRSARRCASDITGYFHQNEGQGLWGTPYPVARRRAALDPHDRVRLAREGIVTSLGVERREPRGRRRPLVREQRLHQARRFYASRHASHRHDRSKTSSRIRSAPIGSTTSTPRPSCSISKTPGRSATPFASTSGFARCSVENEAEDDLGPEKSGTIEAEDTFLPQVGLNWALSENLELFTSVAENMRAFASSGTSGPFSTSAAGFAAIRDVVEPEKATNFEAGLRFRPSDAVEGLVALYNVDFEDRLLGIPQGPGIVGNPAVLANVGSVKTEGIETRSTGVR